MNWKVVAVLLLAFGGLAFAAGWRMRTPAPPMPPLPPDVIPVEVVREIPVPGPERVVERVQWRTKTVQVAGPAVEVLVGALCPQEPTEAPPPGQPPSAQPAADLPDLVGDISIAAQKYEGERGGKLVQGWAGTATCSVGPPGGGLEVLFSEPFDLHASSAVSTVPPLVLRPRRTEVRLGLTSAPGLEVGVSRYGKRRVGWWVSASVDWSPEQWETYRETEDGSYFARETAQSARVAGGLAWSFGRR